MITYRYNAGDPKRRRRKWQNQPRPHEHYHVIADGESGFTAGVDPGFETLDMGGAHILPLTGNVVAHVDYSGGAGNPRIERLDRD